ncbi:MAG: mandelate racemase/muconate lactonizing enzyme family protein, partial [Candidatus Bathyarchaeia archaeon]
GHTTERGLKYSVECVKALKEVLGDEYGLALDCGPGYTIPAAIQLARDLEPMDVLWLEDLLTGDYYPYTEVEAYRIVKSSTTTPIHTGEQIYLREGFRDLIERNAVDVVGPDPCDAGGIYETKWIAELADLHGVLIAPHSGLNGPIELMAAVHMAATLPKNFIALEFPFAPIEWWEGNLVKGTPSPIVKDGFVEVPDKPGLGVELNEQAVEKHLTEEDKDFFE